MTELQEYHYKLYHIPGWLNKKADLLSRRADHNQGSNDNDVIIVLKLEVFARVMEWKTDVGYEEILDKI